MVSTSLSISTSEATEMLHAKVSRAIVLPNGALTTKNEADRPTFNAFKGVGLSLAVLLGEALHLLKDGVITELRASEHRVM